MSKFCSHCGNVLKPGAKFCVSCGTPVGQEREGRNYQENFGQRISKQNILATLSSMISSTRKKGMPRLLLMIVPIIILAAVIWGHGGEKQPYLEPIKKLEKGINNKDMDLIRGAFTDNIADMIGDEDEFLEEFPDSEYSVKLEVVGSKKVPDPSSLIGEYEELVKDEVKWAEEAYLLRVKVTVTMTNSDGEENEYEETIDIPVVRTDKHWGIALKLWE